MIADVLSWGENLSVIKEGEESVKFRLGRCWMFGRPFCREDDVPRMDSPMRFSELELKGELGEMAGLKSMEETCCARLLSSVEKLVLIGCVAD